MTPRRKITVLAWLLLLPTLGMLATAFYYGHRNDPEPAAGEPEGGPPTRLDRALPAFRLTDQAGQPFTNDSLKGRIWIAAFMFTRCNGPCPTTSERMRQMQAQLPPDGRVRLLSISVDGETDTPEVLREYAARYGADLSRWTFVTGPPAKVQELARAVHMEVGNRDALSQQVLHPIHLLLIDASGNVAVAYKQSPEHLKAVVTDAVSLANKAAQR